MLLEERFVFLDDSWNWEKLQPTLEQYLYKLIHETHHVQLDRDCWLYVRNGYFSQRHNQLRYRLRVISGVLFNLKIPQQRCIINSNINGFLIGKGICQFKLKDNFFMEEVPNGSLPFNCVFKGKVT